MCVYACTSVSEVCLCALESSVRVHVCLYYCVSHGRGVYVCVRAWISLRPVCVHVWGGERKGAAACVCVCLCVSVRLMRREQRAETTQRTAMCFTHALLPVCLPACLAGLLYLNESETRVPQRHHHQPTCPPPSPNPNRPSAAPAGPCPQQRPKGHSCTGSRGGGRQLATPLTGSPLSHDSLRCLLHTHTHNRAATHTKTGGPNISEPCDLFAEQKQTFFSFSFKNCEENNSQRGSAVRNISIQRALVGLCTFDDDDANPLHSVLWLISAKR